MAEGVEASVGSARKEEQPTPESDSLEKRLDKFGLDTTFWTDKLKECLGIDKVAQIDHIGPKEVETLCKLRRFTWEERALYKFSNVDINYSRNELENFRKKLQEARKEFENEKFYTGNGHLDAKTPRSVGTTDRKWIHTDNLPSILKERLDKIVNEKQKSEIARNITTCIPSDVSTLLQNASGGVALRGRSYDEKTKSYSNKHRQLIQQPTNVTLKQPVQTSKERTFEFESKRQADEFSDSWQKTGGVLSLINTVADIGAVSSEHKQSTKNSDQKFCSRIHWQWIPTGSIELNPNTLKLSDEALQALKKIDEIKRFDGDGKHLQAACQDFFFQIWNTFVCWHNPSRRGVYIKLDI